MPAIYNAEWKRLLLIVIDASTPLRRHPLKLTRVFCTSFLLFVDLWQAAVYGREGELRLTSTDFLAVVKFKMEEHTRRIAILARGEAHAMQYCPGSPVVVPLLSEMARSLKGKGTGDKGANGASEAAASRANGASGVAPRANIFATGSGSGARVPGAEGTPK